VDCPEIGEVRGLGAMVGVELVTDRETKVPATQFTERVLRRALVSGVICLKAGTHGNVIRFLAPLNTPAQVLAEAMDVLSEVMLDESRASRLLAAPR
jgi:4-aminobutyrate aminotransferase/(S)-3-amino-2-methylpropionate transaminase